MIATVERPRPAAVRLAFRARPFELVSSAMLRFGLVFFLMKDLMLLAAAVWTAGDALRAAPSLARRLERPGEVHRG